MKFTYCLSSVVFLMYFSVVVLVIVNGQSTTTDEDADKAAIMKMIARVAQLSRGNDINDLSNELATMKRDMDKVKDELAKVKDEITKLCSKIEEQMAAGKWNSFIEVHSNLCVMCDFVEF